MSDDGRNTPAVAHALRQLIASHFNTPLPASDQSPLQQGMDFDSVSLIQLIVLIEEHFQIRFDEIELKPETFGDMSHLAALISAKLQDSP